MATAVWTGASRGRKILIVVFAIVVVLALAVWIASIVLRPAYPTPAAISDAARAQARLTGGAKAYATHCAYCHDKGFGPSFAGQGLDAATVRSIARSGPNNMPAFPPSQVSDDELAQIAAYTATLPKVEVKP